VCNGRAEVDGRGPDTCVAAVAARRRAVRPPLPQFTNLAGRGRSTAGAAF